MFDRLNVVIIRVVSAAAATTFAFRCGILLRWSCMLACQITQRSKIETAIQLASMCYLVDMGIIISFAR